jgi:4'-phosphopantetheinyl transferase EntD
VAKESRRKTPINSHFERPVAKIQPVSPPNTAALSPDIAGLFPERVVAAELVAPGDPELLYPEESLDVARAVRKRVQEFAAGRLCARRALAEIGITGFPLRARPDRVPQWPDSVVGSISHTAGYCAAVVAERRHYLALGLDIERVGDLKPELWPRICTATETRWLQSVAQADRQAAACMIFSVKEALYKCHYPATGERLNFNEVCVSPIGPVELDRSRRAGAASITLAKSSTKSGDFTGAAQCRYRLNGEYLIAAVCVPAA